MQTKISLILTMLMVVLTVGISKTAQAQEVNPMAFFGNTNTESVMIVKKDTVPVTTAKVDSTSTPLKVVFKPIYGDRCPYFEVGGAAILGGEMAYGGRIEIGFFNKGWSYAGEIIYAQGKNSKRSSASLMVKKNFIRNPETKVQVYGLIKAGMGQQLTGWNMEIKGKDLNLGDNLGIYEWRPQAGLGIGAEAKVAPRLSLKFEAVYDFRICESKAIPFESESYVEGIDVSFKDGKIAGGQQHAASFMLSLKVSLFKK